MKIEEKDLEWFYKIKELNEEGKGLEDIPEEERPLYIENFGELSYNWDVIYRALFNLEPIYDEEIPTCPLPHGIEKMYEVDEQGKPTGNYNWDYAIQIVEDAAGTDIHNMWNIGKDDEINEVLDVMPRDVACLLAEIDNLEELFSMDFDSNCPKEMRGNRDLIYAFFELAYDTGDIERCWEFMNEELQHDKAFISKIMKLLKEKQVDCWPIVGNIDSEIFKNDDDFMRKMINCFGFDFFWYHWEESKHLFDESIDKLNDEDFSKSSDYIWNYDLAEENLELTQKMYDEEKRRNKIVENKNITAQDIEKMSIDEKINYYINNDKFVELRDLLGLTDEVMAKIFCCKYSEEEIPVEILQKILIARDKKDMEKEGGKTLSTEVLEGKEIDLEDEFRNYNIEIEENEYVIVVRAKTKDGKDRVLYYYNDSNNDWTTRQERIYNSNGDIESMHRYLMTDRLENVEKGLVGEQDRLSLTNIDTAILSYKYDEKGNKKVALYQDDLTGMEYYEYDKNGNIKLGISKEAITQHMVIDGKNCWVASGYFEPTKNGYIWKTMPPIETLTPDDMERCISANLDENMKEKLMDEFDQENKEEVLRILKTVKPIFERLETDVQKNEKEIKRSMDKIVQWFKGFAPRLNKYSKIAQDNAVMSVMKKAVGKSIGNTQEAEIDLSTWLENELEGDEYDF